MILTTHAVTGAVVGALASNNLPVAAFAGLASHFLLDAIPHMDYHLWSSHEDEVQPLNNDIDVWNPHFLSDLLKIGFDMAFGLLLVVILFFAADPRVFLGALVGAVFAILPDPLQFIYMKTRREPFVTIQKFHIFMDTKIKLKRIPWLGISTQILLVLIMISLNYYLAQTL